MKKYIYFVLFYSIILSNTISALDVTDDYTGIGNQWYTPHTFYIQQGMELGVSGSKDFLSETFLFEYTVQSKIRHSFSIRNYHLGYTSGILTKSFDYFNFAVMAGFEYCFKAFDSKNGLFVFTDIGGCNQGFAINAGVGIGNRVLDGFEMNFMFLQNVGFFSRMDFYFLLFNVLILHGKTGIDMRYHETDILLFTFLSGFYIGFSIQNYFRFELGGGFTINDNNIFNGFGGAVISMKFPGW
jgi:hypothetical protein